MTKRFVLFISLAGVTSANADFTWEVSFGAQTLNHLGQPLTGSKTDSSAGFFVELMYAGSNGVIDGPSNAPGNVVVNEINIATFTSSPKFEFGDDLRVGVSYYGEGTTFLGVNGFFKSPTAITQDGTREFDGGSYYLRAWAAPASNYNTGNYLTAFQVDQP